MKVVYFGSDVFLSCFEYFVEKHQVLALYTYHNDEDYFTEYAIVKRAGELGIPSTTRPSRRRISGGTSRRRAASCFSSRSMTAS